MIFWEGRGKGVCVCVCSVCFSFHVRLTVCKHTRLGKSTDEHNTFGALLLVKGALTRLRVCDGCVRPSFCIQHAWLWVVVW